MTFTAANLTPREVAELAGVPKRAVEKAIEEKVLPVHTGKIAAMRFGKAADARRFLGVESVAYATLMRRLTGDVTLTIAGKRKLVKALKALRALLPQDRPHRDCAFGHRRCRPTRRRSAGADRAIFTRERDLDRERCRHQGWIASYQRHAHHRSFHRGSHRARRQPGRGCRRKSGSAARSLRSGGPVRQSSSACRPSPKHLAAVGGVIECACSSTNVCRPILP